MKMVWGAAAACLALAASPSFAILPITHPTDYVFQAYASDSNGLNAAFNGFKSPSGDNVQASPGVLSFNPGVNWKNYISAANAGQPYSMKSIVLKKQTSSFIQCSDVYYSKVISQLGTKNIRTWWPLMYEAPGTTWTLNILTGTSSPWDDDGAGPNPPSYVHNDIWTWKVDADFDSLLALLKLFHQTPFGTDEVPLISDETLYPTLVTLVTNIKNTYQNDPASAGLTLQEFELSVMDSCIGISPTYPNVSGPGTGIAQTWENPACCKLLVDAEYIGKKYGIFSF